VNSVLYFPAQSKSFQEIKDVDQVYLKNRNAREKVGTGKGHKACRALVNGRMRSGWHALRMACAQDGMVGAVLS